MSDLRIVILGPGCAHCELLEANVRQAAADLGYLAHVEHVRDAARINDFGVVRTPALVVNGEVLVVGKVPTAAEIRDLLTCSPAR